VYPVARRLASPSVSSADVTLTKRPVRDTAVKAQNYFRRSGLQDTVVLQRLEEIAERLGVELRYENLGLTGFRTEGGFCRLEGKPMILINRKDPRSRKIRTLARSLGRLNLEGIFIPPAIRRLLGDREI
jgi:hypothetical protein